VQVQPSQPTLLPTQQQIANRTSTNSHTTAANTASSIYGTKSSVPVPVQQRQLYPGYGDGTNTNQVPLPERNNQPHSAAPASSVNLTVPTAAPSNSTLQASAQSAYGATMATNRSSVSISAPTATSAQSIYATAPQPYIAGNRSNNIAHAPAATTSANKPPDSASAHLVSSAATAKPSSPIRQSHTASNPIQPIQGVPPRQLTKSSTIVAANVPGFDDDFDISDSDLAAIDALAAAAQKRVCTIASWVLSLWL
jgi:hypothetical protein